jgi:predicted glycosyltransferase
MGLWVDRMNEGEVDHFRRLIVEKEEKGVIETLLEDLVSDVQ